MGISLTGCGGSGADSKPDPIVTTPPAVDNWTPLHPKRRLIYHYHVI